MQNGRTPLRIAMIMPPWYEVPPAGYGGLERVCASLIDGLVARGHHVTMFGTGTRTGTKARFVSTNPQLQYPRLLEALPELVHVTRANELLGRDAYDVVHDHTTIGPVTAPQRDQPSVVTVHGCPTGPLNAYLSRVDKQVSLVAISHAQRRIAPNLTWAATIHHGIEVDRAIKARPSDGPVLWLGRFDPEKGPDIAIEACRRAGLPLVLAGKCNQAAEWRYLDEEIRPMLSSSASPSSSSASPSSSDASSDASPDASPDVQLLVNAERTVTDRLLAEARSLLMSIRWEEPFGMVMIEAMAKGTPVVALRHGSVQEVVAHGRTGLVCDHPTQLPTALHAAQALKPAECAAHVARLFSPDLMARRYEDAYRAVIARAVSPVAAAAAR